MPAGIMSITLVYPTRIAEDLNADTQEWNELFFEY